MLKTFLAEHTSFEIVDRNGWFYAVKHGLHEEELQPVAFRADMDALPMEEGLPLEHASANPGIAHKCGHDGHMAALCGLALELEERDLDRTVYLIFQPAEEIGRGAQMCAGLIQEKGISEIYAFHNLSGYPEGSVVYREGLTQPASEGIVLRFYGRQSHASAPEEGLNPAQVIAALALYAQELPGRTASKIAGEMAQETVGKKADEADGLSAWCTVVGMHCGESDFGISPGEGLLAVTLRSEKEAEMKEMESELVHFAADRAAAAGLTVEHEISDYFPETRNHDKQLLRVLACAGALGLDCVQMQDLWRASEDFGHYLKICPGAIFYIGNGEEYPPLHTREYDFNDRILGTAVDVMTGLACGDTE